MHGKGVVQAWLGAGLATGWPGAELWGGNRKTHELLREGDPGPDRRMALMECVGSLPRTRFLRSSRIDKNQVRAYTEDPRYVPWTTRVFFVLGHAPPEWAEAGGGLSIVDAGTYLRCIALADAIDHIGHTGRGTINDELLEELSQRPSNHHPYPMAIPLGAALGLVADSHALKPDAARRNAHREHDPWAQGGGLSWMGQPTPLCVAIDATHQRGAMGG